MPRALAKHSTVKDPVAGIYHNRPAEPLPLAMMPRNPTRRLPKTLPSPFMEPLAVRRKEAAALLSVGMTKVKEMLKTGELEEVRLGTASLVTMRSVRKLVGETSSTA